LIFLVVGKNVVAFEAQRKRNRESFQNIQLPCNSHRKGATFLIGQDANVGPRLTFPRALTGPLYALISRRDCRTCIGQQLAEEANFAVVKITRGFPIPLASPTTKRHPNPLYGKISQDGPPSRQMLPVLQEQGKAF